MRSSRLLASLLLINVVACSGPSDPAALNLEATRALATRPQRALVAFQEARSLVGEDPADDQFLVAELGIVDAHIQLGEHPEAQDRFLALARTHPELVDAHAYSRVGQRLAGRDPSSGLAVFHAGFQRYPESDVLRSKIERLKVLASTPGDPTASTLAQELQSIGYLGGD